MRHVRSAKGYHFRNHTVINQTNKGFSLKELSSSPLLTRPDKLVVLVQEYVRSSGLKCPLASSLNNRREFSFETKEIPADVCCDFLVATAGVLIDPVLF